MDNTFISLYRKSINSRVFKNEGLWKVWTWCLLKASYKERWVTMKTGKAEIEIKILPGQFVFGRLSAAKQLNMKPSTVRNRMEKLKNMRNVDIKEDRQYSIISIINWDAYQIEKIKKDNEEDNRRTGKGQAKDTNNNVNKVKEKKKVPKKKLFSPPIKNEVQNYFFENGYTKESGLKAFEYYEAGDWKDSRGNQVKSWKQKMRGVWFKDENKIPVNNIRKIKTIEDREAEDRELFANRTMK